MNENTFLIFENHYLGDVLDKYKFDTFFNEHPRTYSLESFKKIAQQLDREISKCEFVSRYGGNIRVFISKKVPVGEFKEENRFQDKFFALD